MNISYDEAIHNTGRTALWGRPLRHATCRLHSQQMVLGEMTDVYMDFPSREAAKEFLDERMKEGRLSPVWLEDI